MTAMKQISFGILGVLCVVLNFATVTWCQDRTVGRALIRSGLTNIQATCTGSFGPKCADCNTILTCANIEINKQPCSTINSNTPYCVKNACTDVPPPGCALPFTCTGSGLFPDPNDCRRYYLCEGPSGKSVTYECPKEFAYESRTGLCKRKQIPQDCQTIDCSRKSNNYVLFAGDRSIMAYCQNVSNKKQTILFRCPDSENMEYNLKSLSCKFKCKAEGRYADRLNCRKFYECYWDGTGFGHKSESCPTGFWYNPDRKQCERRDHCKPEIIEDEVFESGSGGGISLFF